jgi:ATP-dependent DNA helicase RecG
MRFDSNEAARYCCALSNWGGGKLILGISDKRPRQVIGSRAFEQPERTRKGLMDKLRIRVDFNILEYHGKRVLVFDVAGRPSGLPVLVDGVAWWRDGDSLVPMPEDVRRRIYAETGFDFSGSVCKGATVNDLDGKAINAFRNIWAEKSENNRIKNLSTEQLLVDCEAFSDGGVTYAALVLFGTRSALGKYLPQSEIVFEYRSLDASGPAQQREEFRVGFFSCYDRLWELINLRNDKQHYQEGLFVFDIPTFNERVVREVLLNAVSHRNYQLSGSVFVRQYRNRLVVESPGGFPTGVTLENFLDRQSPRNRRIAEILALCGLVEHVSRNKFVLARSLYEITDKSGTHTRLVGLDRDTNKELLIKHIRKNGMKGTPFKELEQVLPSHSRNQIKVLVRELKQANSIYVVGKTSSARWYTR